MSRTTAELVKGILMDDYGARLDGTLPDLTQFIEEAALLTDGVVEYAAGKGKTLSADRLLKIETRLAGHGYVMSDQNFASKSTGGASGSYQGQTGMRLEASKHGQMAMMLDTSGYLIAINKQARAGARWLGKPLRDQLSYDDRS